MRDAFRHSKERRIAMFGGMAIMVAITILSCVSSYTIDVDGFRDMPYVAQQALALFAVVVVEGTFIWLLFSIGRAFSSSLERFFAVLGLVFIVGVMALNVVTHFMQAKLIPLHRYQTECVNWGAVLVVMAILVLVLFIQLADPVARLIRLELRYMGRQEETILAAKSEALDSERIQTAMANRADAEAEKLAQRMEGESAFPRELVPTTTSNWGRSNGSVLD